MENNLDSIQVPNHFSNQNLWHGSNLSIPNQISLQVSNPNPQQPVSGPASNHSRTSPLNVVNIMRQQMANSLNSNIPNGLLPNVNIPAHLMQMAHSLGSARPLEGMLMPHIPNPYHPSMFGMNSSNLPHPSINNSTLPGMHFPPNFGGVHPSRYNSSLPQFSFEHKIQDLNKRLQYRPEENDIIWWETFVTEFFEDDSSLTLIFPMEDGPKQYKIGRILIPRYFRTIFDSGCYELYYVLRYAREQIQHHQIPVNNSNSVGSMGSSSSLANGQNTGSNTQPNSGSSNGSGVANNNSLPNNFSNGVSPVPLPSIVLESDSCDMVMNMNRPMQFCVISEGRLILEFSVDEMRIRNWIFIIRSHREILLRTFLSVPFQDMSLFDQLSKNFTRSGMTSQTLNFLRLCLILEPMQELMSRQKAYSLSPRDCLKTTLFQKWQKMIAPPESNRTTNKRRKRKNNINNNGDNSTTSSTGQKSSGTSKQKPSPVPQTQNISTSGDVLVVGEPTLMGGNFGDDDERMITRLENVNFPPGVVATNQNSSLSNGVQSQNSQSPSVSSPHSNIVSQSGGISPKSLTSGNHPPVAFGGQLQPTLISGNAPGMGNIGAPNSRQLSTQQQQMNHILAMQQQQQLMMMRAAATATSGGAPSQQILPQPPILGPDDCGFTNNGVVQLSSNFYSGQLNSHPSSVKSEQLDEISNNGFNYLPRSVEESSLLHSVNDGIKSSSRSANNFPTIFPDSYDSKIHPQTPNNSVSFSSSTGSRPPSNFN